ncbi:unnamed protein product [Rhizoctonia solani]|uniref:Uncharacterized protein n=1 Tax=Rhizoctonia solani TaxID=456999 RepID=A0A8H3D2U6_9AGAM|nr:unnamed protein product [Rhizoctonia solani]
MSKALLTRVPLKETFAQSCTPPVPHLIPCRASKSRAVTSELSHAGHDSTRLRRAVKLRHGQVTPTATMDISSRTNSGAKTPTPKFTQPTPTLVRTTSVPTASDRPHRPSSVDKSNPSTRADSRGCSNVRRRAQNIIKKPLPDVSFGAYYLYAPVQDPRFGGSNSQGLQSTNVWI